MQLKNSYYYFTSVLSTEVCQKIIDLGLNKLDNLEKQGENTYGVTSGRLEKQSLDSLNPINEKSNEEIKSTGKNYYRRDSKICWLSDKWIFETLAPYIYEANKAAGWNFDLDYHEQIQFSVYNKNQFYGWHFDGAQDHFSKIKRYIPGITNITMQKDGRLPFSHSQNNNLVGKVRKLSMTVNLNNSNNYEGGDLKFDLGPHSTGNRYQVCEESKKQGSIIVFPSFIPHQVTPVEKGTRYSLVLWSSGNPLR